MINGIDVRFSNTASPIPGDEWTNLTADKRIGLVEKSIQDFSRDMDVSIDLDIIEASEGGQISVSFNDTLSAAERGPLLLDMEEFLKLNVDEGITVWHDPIGDKSSLRNLRGIEVLS